MTKSRVHLKIHGRVQGVFFRANTQREAIQLGLTGWVRNCPDGAVETIAEGETEKVEEFIQWCRHGPPHAQVTQVDIQRSEFKGDFDGFAVAY